MPVESPMRVLAIVQSVPAVRWYRFENAARHMPEVTYYHNDGQAGWEDRFGEWLAENGLEWDVVWTSDWTNPMAAFLDLLRENGARVVAEVDDLFEDLPEGNSALLAWRGKRRDKYLALLKGADRVVSSTPFLAERHGGLVAPNFIDSGQWIHPNRPTKDLDECVILCPAGTGRVGDYLSQAEAFQAVLELEHVKMVFMGTFPEWALRYPAGKVVWCRWTPIETYTKMMRWIAPDIIVSPMEHNDFNLAKSNLKYLEAGACRAAFVGERWGEYERTVTHGETGLLASTPAEWAEALVGLATDLNLCRGLGKAASDDVQSNWTWEAVGQQWTDAILG